MPSQAQKSDQEEIVKNVTNHFMQKGRTGLPKWQVENVVRSYVTAGGKNVEVGQDYEAIEDLIRRKEVGGLPGTNVKHSPKGPVQDRPRSIVASLEQTL